MADQFQRNQVEGAIAQTLDPKSASPSADIRSCIKRLLDADRLLPCASDRAFSTGASPGTGNANSFCGLDAFMLFLGVRLNMHFWPQKSVVEVLRRARSEISSCYSEIMSLDEKWLFNPTEIEKVKASHYEPDNAKPTFLVVATDANSRAEAEDVKFLVDEPDQAFRMCMSTMGRLSTWFELVTPAHRLQQSIAKIKPAKRGRS
jgi:hypothetical protein